MKSVDIYGMISYW